MRYFLFFTILIQSTFLQSSVSSVPLDDKIVINKLSNGLTYYIRDNQYPENRACLRLVVKVGSIYETEEEQGIAHFLEHLVFRGSTHFKDGEIGKYLESIGSRAGADNNAYTSFDETVYQVDIPLNSPDSLEKALLILNDFASEATLSDDVINKERTVVLDELAQTDSTVSGRYWKKISNSFIPESIYNHRFPIGKREIIENVSPEVLRNFYKKWYRPEKMAVIVIGDIDPLSIEHKIKNIFSKFTSPKLSPDEIEEPSKEIIYPSTPQILLYQDPDLDYTNIELISIYPLKDHSAISQKEIKNDFLSHICSTLLTCRLNNKKLEENKYLDVSASNITDFFTKSAMQFSITANLYEDRWEEGMQSLLYETQKAIKLGFTSYEWDHLSKSFQSSIKTALDNIEKTEHNDYVQECLSHFTEDRPLVSTPWVLDFLLHCLENLTIEEINAHIPSTHLVDAFSIIFSTPSKKLANSIDSELILKECNKELFFDIGENTEEEQFAFSIEPAHETGKIVTSEIDEKYQTTFWTLENGVKIILKKTDLEKGQVRLYAVAPGGLLSVSKEKLNSAKLAISYAVLSGFENYSFSQLLNLSKSNNIYGEFDIGSNTRSIDFTFPSDKTEITLQYLHEILTNPQFNNDQWEHLTTNLKERTKQIQRNDDYLFDRFLWKTISQGNFHFEPLNIDLADPASAKAIFQQYFSNPQDFNFMFVGDIKEEEIAALVEKYLGSIPKKDIEEIIIPDPLDLFPDKIIKENFFIGNNQFATTVVSFPYDQNKIIEYGYANEAICKILTQRLTEILRHQLGKTYGVVVYLYSYFDQDYKNSLVMVEFTSQPEDIDQMTKIILEEIEKVKTVAPEIEEIKTIQALLTEREKLNRLSNEYWINSISWSELMGLPLEDVIESSNEINELSPELITEAAKSIFSNPNYAIISHLPEQS